MKKLSMINKFITVILLGISLYFNSSIMLKYFVFGFIIVCFLNLRCLKLAIFYLIVLLFMFFNINIWFDSERFYYLVMFIGIIILMFKSLSIMQKRYIFDNTLYKSKDMKLIKKHLYSCYYDDVLDNNIKDIEGVINSDNHKYLTNQINMKTKKDLEDLYVLNRIRFYGLYDRKRTIFPDRWGKVDTLYLGLIIIISFIIIYFR